MSTRLAAALALSLAAPAAIAGPAPATAPRLFSLDDGGKEGCAAHIRDAADGKVTRTLFTAKTCPQDVIFDVAGKRMLAADGDALRSFPMGAGGKPAALGKVPAADASVWLEENGKLRAAWLVSRGVDVDEGKTPTTVSFEGKKYPVKSEAWPSWGLPEIAILAELDEATGTWRRLEVVPTKGEAGETPGLDALATPKKPKKGVVSLRDLAGRMACYGGGLHCGDDPPSGALAKIKALTTAELDGAGAIPFGKGALAFALLQGDTVHAFTPLLFCADGAATCAKSTVLEKPRRKGDQGRALGVAARGGYGLFAEEYTGRDATVIDAAGKALFTLPSSSWGVVFLPDELLAP